ncbi:MAG: YihY/virulence factor BrkB family protein [Arenibacterium sp.]
MWSALQTSPLFRLPRLIWRAAARFVAHQGVIFSSHVAMSLMLALFPFVLFVVALAGELSSGFDPDELTDLLFSAWPPEVSQPLIREISAVLAADNTSLMTVGGMLALYFASNGVEAVRVAINAAYRDEDSRPFWRNRLISLVFVALGSAVIVLGLTLGLGLPTYLRYLPDTVPEALSRWMSNGFLQRAVPGILLIFAVSAFHIWLPARRRALSVIWPGVALTIVLWIIAVSGFSRYIASFADYSATYAGLAGAMSALIFLYLLAAILILGAEFNGVLEREKSGAEA